MSSRWEPVHLSAGKGSSKCTVGARPSELREELRQ